MGVFPVVRIVNVVGAGVIVKVCFVLGTSIDVGAGVVMEEAVAIARGVEGVIVADVVEALVVGEDVGAGVFAAGIVMEAGTVVEANVVTALNVVGRGVEVIADVVVVGVSVEIAVAGDVEADAVTLVGRSPEDSPAVEKWSVLAISGFILE